MQPGAKFRSPGRMPQGQHRIRIQATPRPMCPPLEPRHLGTVCARGPPGSIHVCPVHENNHGRSPCSKHSMIHVGGCVVPAFVIQDRLQRPKRFTVCVCEPPQTLEFDSLLSAQIKLSCSFNIQYVLNAHRSLVPSCCHQIINGCWKEAIQRGREVLPKMLGSMCSAPKT